MNTLYSVLLLSVPLGITLGLLIYSIVQPYMLFHYNTDRTVRHCKKCGKAQMRYSHGDAVWWKHINSADKNCKCRRLAI